MATKRQRFLSTSCFSSLLLVGFFFSRQTQLPQWKEGQTESLFFGRVCRVFARQKTQLSLHMNLQRSAAATVKEKDLSQFTPRQKCREAEGEDMLRFVEGWSRGCQASSGLSAPSGIPRQSFASRGGRVAAWQRRQAAARP